MSNPYESPNAPQPAPMQQPVGPVVIQNVPANPIDRLMKAKDMLGEQYWLFLGIAFVGMLIGGAVPFGILMGPMMCGLYLCYQQRMNGGQARFELLFKGFDYFVPSLIATLIMVGISLVIFIPIYVIMMVVIFGAVAASGGGDQAIMTMLPIMLVLDVVIVAASILIYVPFVFVYPLIVDRQLNGLDAVKLSARAAFQNIWTVLAILVVNSLLTMVGVCLCYVPAILLMPLTFGSIFQLYRDVFAVTGPVGK